MKDLAILAHTVTSEFNEKLSQALQVDSNVLSSIQSENFNCISDDFEELLTNLQEEYKQLDTNAKKLEILALLPKSWKFSKMSLYFSITYYMYRKLNEFEQSLSKILIVYTLQIVIKLINF